MNDQADSSVISDQVQVRVQPRVQSRLLRVFVLQLALISLITVAGIFAASLVAEKLLVHQALVGEAKYFWKRRSEDPAFPLPNTLNLQSWFDGDDHSVQVPDAFVDLPAGQHRVVIDGDDRIVYVSEHDNERLFLLFQDETVSDLAFYFGVLPLTLVLLIMYSLAFLAYWLSKRAVSPIASLADFIERFDFNARDASELDLAELPGPGNSETLVLAQALEHFVERSKVSIERERNFTRYASHELRTPIAVIQGSIASLELVALDGAAGRAVARIKKTSEQMAQLINSLLLLARDRNFDDDVESIDVAELVEQIVDEIPAVEKEGPVTTTITKMAPLSIVAPSAVLSIVLGNIIRNARKYTHNGSVNIRIESDRVIISDTGRGLSEADQSRIFEPFYRIEDESNAAASSVSKASVNGGQGLGLGLAIVRHFCDIYRWELAVSSNPGEGSRFSVIFGQGET